MLDAQETQYLTRQGIGRLRQMNARHVGYGLKVKTFLTNSMPLYRDRKQVTLTQTASRELFDVAHHLTTFVCHLGLIHVSPFISPPCYPHSPI